MREFESLLNHSFSVPEQSGAVEACWAHNPKVGGSKPPSATFLPGRLARAPGSGPGGRSVHPKRRFGRVVKALAC